MISVFYIFKKGIKIQAFGDIIDHERKGPFYDARERNVFICVCVPEATKSIC